MAQKKTSSRKKTRQTKSQKEEEELIALVRKRAQAYLRLPNITSVGVGIELKNGEPTGKLSVQFTVNRKLSPELLALENLRPLPEFIISDDGTEIPIDVVERSYKPAYQIIDEPIIIDGVPESLTPAQMRRTRINPILPGISISNANLSSGTFGAVVYDAMTRTPYILSNWHVLCGPAGNIGDIIVQPGTSDSGNINANIVGRLVRSHLSVAGDCAVASISGRQLEDRLLELNIVPNRIAKVNLGDKVVKSGRTTGVTYGIVTRVGVAVNMNYGSVTQTVGGFEIKPNPNKPAEYGEISMAGDSGSLWLIDTQGVDKDVVVGLLFAGENNPAPAAEHSVACYIHSVIEKLQITFNKP